MATQTRVNSALENANATREPDTSDGIVGSVFALSIGMVENGVRTSATVARTLTEETHKVVDAVIQFGEQGSQAVLRTAHKLTDSSFGLLTDAIGRTEQAALVMLTHGQKTSDRVAELAAQASQAALGSRGLNSMATTRA
jgi:hypothetical protein